MTIVNEDCYLNLQRAKLLFSILKAFGNVLSDEIQRLHLFNILKLLHLSEDKAIMKEDGGVYRLCFDDISNFFIHEETEDHMVVSYHDSYFIFGRDQSGWIGYRMTPDDLDRLIDQDVEFLFREKENEHAAI